VKADHAKFADIVEGTPSCRLLVVKARANAEHVFGEGVEVGDVLHEQLRWQRSGLLYNRFAVFVARQIE